MYLSHHGIQGQKWGVRNGPPYPLNSSKKKKTRLTREQKKAIKNVKKTAKTKSKVDEIVNTLSNKEKELLAIDPDSKEWLTIEEGEHVVKRFLKEVGNVPVSFFDLLDDGDEIQLALATRSGDEYRGKGYASEAAEQAMRWLKRHPNKRKGRDVVWGVREDNAGSIKIAKKMGFVEDPSSRNNGWVNYVNKVK